MYMRKRCVSVCVCVTVCTCVHVCVCVCAWHTHQALVKVLNLTDSWAHTEIYAGSSCEKISSLTGSSSQSVNSHTGEEARLNRCMFLLEIPTRCVTICRGRAILSPELWGSLLDGGQNILCVYAHAYACMLGGGIPQSAILQPKSV